MPLYILLSSLTDEGRKTVKSKPERIKEVNKEIEGMGAKVLGQYAVLGLYDFVNVVEARSNDTMVKISVTLGSRGTIQIMTLPAMTIDQFIKTLKGSPRTHSQIPDPTAGGLRSAGRILFLPP